MKNLKIPKIGEYVRHAGVLVAIEKIYPPTPKPYNDYIFEEVEARCELRLNGKTIKELYTLNDFYGLGESLKEAISEMQDYVRRQKITPQSDLEAVVIKVVSQHRKQITDQESIYSKDYARFDYKPNGSTFDLPEPIETIVWSSKTSTTS